MGKLELLSGFLDMATDDARLLPTHISLYIAIFFEWDRNGYRNPVLVKRDELMHVSKILGRSTYQRCIQQLASYGYITYKVSFNHFESSQVYLK